MLPGIFQTSAANSLHATKAELASDQAASLSREAQRETALLRADVEKLFMITEALWTLLKEHGEYTDETLIELIRTIDLKDGRLDGKARTKIRATCPHCGKIAIGTHPLCLYCGAEIVQSPFER